MNRRHSLSTLAALLAGGFLPRSGAAQSAGFLPYANRPEVQTWAQEFAKASDWPVQEVLAILAQGQSSEAVIRAMQPGPPGFKKSWKVYRSRFVEPIRIKAGVAFWNQWATDLARAQVTFDVAAEIIVGIIGVETLYGRNTGQFRVIDALMTLSFDYTRRADYFKSELAQLLLYSRENALDPLTLLGSYAGAIGIGQFMPSSIRKHAVDFDGDGTIDLRNSPVDAIGSVAHYLAQHGWQAGQPIALPAKANRHAQVADLLASGPEPRYSLEELQAAGISALEPVPDNAKLLLVDLPTGDHTVEYRIGLANFYAITRYNKSFFYAAAVQDLGAAIARAR
jgi:membrane-bound lytic murein transglycosylase B